MLETAEVIPPFRPPHGFRKSEINSSRQYVTPSWFVRAGRPIFAIGSSPVPFRRAASATGRPPRAHSAAYA
jgi:hypothetical protein